MNKYIELIAHHKMRNVMKDLQSNKMNFDFDVDDLLQIKMEISKLLNFFDHTYINSDFVRMYYINDDLLYFDTIQIKHIKSLLEHAIKIGLTDEVELLSYYLVSLNYSYTKGMTYQSNANNSAYLKQFYSIFDKRGFYCGSLVDGAKSFSRDVIAYAAEDKENVFGLNDLLLDCLRFCYSNECADFQKSINQLVQLRTHYNRYFITYDSDIASNFQTYFEIELSRISDDLHNNITVLKNLYAKGLIDEKHEAQMLAIARERFSRIKGDSGYLTKLVYFEKMEKDIGLLRNINCMSQNLKEDLNILTYELQGASRSLIKYQQPELRRIEHKMDIPREHIENALAEYDKNLMGTILKMCIIRFDNWIHDSLYAIVDSISNLVSKINIDNKEEGLFSGDDKNVPVSAFNEYYSDKMEAYLKNNREEFLNPHIYERKNAYRGLLNYVKEFIYPIQIGIQVNILEEKFGTNVERIICEEIGFPSERYNDDYYIMQMNMIDQIEGFLTTLYNHFQNENRTSFEEVYLERIFEHVKNNAIFANGLMHLNFTLYDKNGLRIRDKLAHGNMPSGFRDLVLLLMVLVSYIFVSAFFDQNVGGDKI